MFSFCTRMYACFFSGNRNSARKVGVTGSKIYKCVFLLYKTMPFNLDMFWQPYEITFTVTLYTHTRLL